MPGRWDTGTKPGNETKETSVAIGRVDGDEVRERMVEGEGYRESLQPLPGHQWTKEVTRHDSSWFK